MLEEALASGKKVHQSWQVVIVSKTLYLYLSVLTNYGCNEIIVAHSCLAVIMIGGTTVYSTDSSPDLEEHVYGLEDPWALPY